MKQDNGQGVVSESPVSLHKFSKDNGLAKSSVYRRCKDLGIDTSVEAGGLSKKTQELLLEEFGVSTATTAEVFSGEIMPSGYGFGGLVPRGEGASINLHIHVGDREFFQTKAGQGHGEISRILESVFAHAEAQGAADGAEVEALAQYAKAEAAKKRLGAFAKGQQQQAES